MTCFFNLSNAWLGFEPEVWIPGGRSPSAPKQFAPSVRDLVDGGSEREQCQVAPEEAMRRGGSGISLFTGWEGRHRSRAEIESIWCMEWGIGEGQQRAGIETKCLSFCCRRTLCFPQHAWLIIESRTALACFCLATSPGKSQRSTRRQ